MSESQCFAVGDGEATFPYHNTESYDPKSCDASRTSGRLRSRGDVPSTSALAQRRYYKRQKVSCSTSTEASQDCSAGFEEPNERLERYTD